MMWNHNHKQPCFFVKVTQLRACLRASFSKCSQHVRDAVLTVRNESTHTSLNVASLYTDNTSDILLISSLLATPILQLFETSTVQLKFWLHFCQNLHSLTTQTCAGHR